MTPDSPAPDAPPGTDEVDRIVAAWRRERPDIDVSPLTVLSRVSRLAHHLDALRRRAFASVALEPWEFDVLSALRRAGAPYRSTPGHMLSQTLVTSGTMSVRIDKLVARALVRRRADERDRRTVQVELTPEGLRTADEAMTALTEVEDAVLAALSPTEREQLAGLLRILLLPLEKEEDR